MKDKLVEIFLDFSKDHMEIIEKLADFQPIWSYPKLSETHSRCWGYIISDKNVFFLRVKNQEETIQEMAEGFYQIRVRLAGLDSLLKNSVVSISNVCDELNPLIGLCTAMISQYKESNER